PCLKAFLFPFGAPGDGPPCIRHRPFGIAGAWQGVPFLVRAPHRGLRCIANLLRKVSILWSRRIGGFWSFALLPPERAQLRRRHKLFGTHSSPPSGNSELPFDALGR